MIRLRKGNTRIAIIFFKFLVIKIPNPRFDRHTHAFRTRETFFRFLAGRGEDIYEALLSGVLANLSEAVVYRNGWGMTEYLVPVFSLGICNFQRYQGEERPTKTELETMVRGLSEDLQSLFFKADPHERSTSNWRKTRSGLRLIDYAADPLKTPWADFLLNSRKELSQATAKV